MTKAGWENNKNIVVIFNTVTWMKGEPASADKVAALKSYRGEQIRCSIMNTNSKDLNVIIIIIIFRNISDNFANIIA